MNQTESGPEYNYSEQQHIQLESQT